MMTETEIKGYIYPRHRDQGVIYPRQNTQSLWGHSGTAVIVWCIGFDK